MAIRQSKNLSAGPSVVPYADMSLDGPEIGTLVAVVDRAKNLPNRRTMGKQDPYCAMRLGKEAKKTETDRRGGQTPRWDQELRFTVHDSPDYYKLKCSVFNDDKKAEMIGEAWIDLKQLVVPGGGQNDLWHQLNFKGKYAGDIRMELTYYDTRVNPELEAGKQRQREKGYGNDNASNASTSRHLGPREIKRRPLPPGPTQSAPVELPQPFRPQRQLPPQPGTPHITSQHQHQPPPIDSDPYAPPPPPQQQHWTTSSRPDDYALDLAAPYDPYPREDRQFQSQDYQAPYTPSDRRESSGYLESRQSYGIDPRPVVQHPYPEPHPEDYDYSSPVSSYGAQPSSPFTPYNSSPPIHHNPPTLPEISSRSPQVSTSPTKHAPYRDSPLRQSVSPYEIHTPNMCYGDAFDDLDAPPPPPPSHRNSLPRPPSSAHNTPPQLDQFRRLPQPPFTIGDRSPLQLIEQQFSPQHQQEQRTPDCRKPRKSYSSQGTPDFRPNVAGLFDDAVAGDFPAPHQLTQNFGVDFAAEPVEQDHQGRYIRRNSGLDDGPYRLPQRAHTFDTADVFDERNTYRSEPQIIRPRAVSPNAGHSIPRKSVSPHPQPRDGRSRVGDVPFGPESYDVLNPASDPASDAYSTPARQHEDGRQRNVETLAEQGPIIDNDGRVIDPSDHLPSDTWAPEPERKARKPEHVIRIRTRDDARNSRAGSSPLPIKPMSAANSPYQPLSPASNSPYQPTPDQTPPPSAGQRRNRLQKQTPNRPLPVQPFQHAHSSPASIPQINDFPPHHQTPPRNSMPSSPLSGQHEQRHSTYNTPPGGVPSRPPLSDYQVPTANNNRNYSHNPRNSSHALPPSQQQRRPLNTPTKLATQRPQSYAAPTGRTGSVGGYEDPLAAELSLIDIGPSRMGGGRTALRSNRGYNGAY